jgi:hypothetical protein
MRAVSRVGRILACSAAAFALMGGTAVANASAPAGKAPAAPTAPSKLPKPLRGRLALHLAGVFHIHSGAVTVTGRAVRVNGVVRPFVPGQTVVVHAFFGRRLIHSERVRVISSRGGTYGHFSVRFSTAHAGDVFVSAVQASSKALGRLVAYAGFTTVDPQAGFGSTGRFVQLIQSRLAALHLFIPQSGVYDSFTGLAIDAYHRLLGWGTSQALDYPTTVSLLDGVGTFRLHDPRVRGKHAEGNLSKQLLALANGAHVYRIYPISSGKPSTPTVLGHFTVQSKVPGYLPDGMFYSNFFSGGYAIHGYDPAPDYPASHGCIRVPIQDAVSIYAWLNLGDMVDVYS